MAGDETAHVDPSSTRAGRLGAALAWRWPRRGAGRCRRPRTSEINLALQGGGAHGAFTWGVLDRLLEADCLRFDGISGTSAGAINAVAFASGWITGGAAGARAALAELWRQVASASSLPAGQLPPLILDATVQLLSPYQLNPLGINPLRTILQRVVDFERLCRERSLKLFVAAMNVRTGATRIFRNADLSPDAVLASASLPLLHHAVEIDGEAYWDGGYVSNPPLLPLVECCRTRDLLLVRINPSARSAVPSSARGIRNRIGEIVFDQPLERELSLLQGRHPRLRASRAQRRLARHRLHVIDGREALSRLNPITKVVPDWDTLVRLRDLGRAAAASWLEGDRRTAKRRIIKAAGSRAFPP